MPRHAILIVNRKADWGDKSPGEIQGILGEYFAWIDDLQTRGTLVDCRALRDGGRVVQMVDGEVVDGPFTETKEVVGGFFLVDTPDDATAQKMARTCPALKFGDLVELRRVSNVNERREE